MAKKQSKKKNAFLNFLAQKLTNSWDSFFIINATIFPHIFVVANFFLILETVSFEGFVRKYFFVPTQFFFFTTIISFLGVIWLRYSQREKGSTFVGLTKFILDLNKLSILPILLINYLLVTIEVYNYPNYAYSHFHINPYNFSSIVSLNVVILILQILVGVRYRLQIQSGWMTVDYQYVITAFAKRKYSFVHFCFFGLVFLCVFPQVQDILQTMHVVGVKFIQNMNKTEKEKFAFELGGEKYTGWIVPFTDFVNEHVPEHATIFTPPQKESWQMEGNQYFLRWFLYPRNIVTSQDINAEIPAETDYVMIAYGAWPWGVKEFGWPRLSIPKEKIARIIYIDRQTREVSAVENEDYVFVPNKEVWGVIELKK
jgi:hypothetical protein